MAMLATLEGTETTGTDDYILSRMFSPNDGLGVELMGVVGWNMAKSKAANAARNVLKAKRLFIVPEIIYCDPTPCRDDLAGVLFGLDESYCNELLGYSLTNGLKKAVSGIAKSVKSVTNKVKTASINPVKSARDSAKAALKQAKKYSTPTKALQLSLSPTLQAKAIAKTDPTGISTAAIDKTYKLAPDVLPSLTADVTTKKTVKYDPTGISQKLYKVGTKAAKAPDYLSPGKLYDETKKQAAKKKATDTDPAETVAPVQVNTAPADSITPQTPTVIYYPQTTTTAPAETVAPAGFDWSGLLNWKTALVAGGVAYLIFGRGGKRGRK